MREYDAPDVSEQLDQMSPSDTLIDRGLVDALDEGFTPPDKWSPAQGFGNTPAEMRQGETIEQRVAQEEPEEDPKKLHGKWNPAGEPRQVGSKRAGRLVAGEDIDADDVGIDGAGACAEEAAMHIIDEDDLADDGEDEPESESSQQR